MAKRKADTVDRKKRVNFMVSTDEMTAIVRLAQERETTVSAMLRELVLGVSKGRR
jgi:hypothetical protein